MITLRSTVWRVDCTKSVYLNKLCFKLLRTVEFLAKILSMVSCATITRCLQVDVWFLFHVKIFNCLLLFLE